MADQIEFYRSGGRYRLWRLVCGLATSPQLWGQRSHSYNRRPLREHIFVINRTK